MKKVMTYLAAAMLLALPVTLTSCDDPYYEYWYGDDEPWWFDYYGNSYGWNNNYWGSNNDDYALTTLDEAQVLAGEWDGTINYTNGDDGSVSSFNATMTFVQNNVNAIKGTGTEYDYVLDSNNNIVDDQTLKFNWYIDDNTGDIYIKYASGSTFVLDISAREHGFYLDENKGLFNGYMIGTNNRDLIEFDFVRVVNNNAKGAAVTRATTVKTFGQDVVRKQANTTAIKRIVKR